MPPQYGTMISNHARADVTQLITMIQHQKPVKHAQRDAPTVPVGLAAIPVIHHSTLCRLMEDVLMYVHRTILFGTI